MLALVPCGGRSVEVNTLGCGPGGEGSIPSAHPIFPFQLSARSSVDRASGFEPEGRGFKSLRACQEQSKVKKPLQKCRGFSVNCCNFVVTALNKYLLMVLIARLNLVGAIGVAQVEISLYRAFLVGAGRSIHGSELLPWRVPVG